MAKKKEKTLEEKLQEALVPENQWPYILPENWCWTKGKYILEKMESQKPEGDYFYYIDIDAIDNSCQIVTEPKQIAVCDAPSRASRKLHVGDTIFSLVRPYLKNIAYIDKSLSNSIASTGFYVCTPKKNVFPKFFYWLMISPYVVDGLNKYMKGDNSPSIRGGDIEGFCYPIPPLPEQKRIVYRIESLFAKLDEAKEKIQQVLDGAEMRKAAILHKAFTGELTQNWRKENTAIFENSSLGIDEELISDNLKELPDKWCWCKIGDFLELKAGKNIKADNISIEKNNNNKYACYGGNGIRGYVDSFNVEGTHIIIGRQGALCGNINIAENKFYATEHAVVVYPRYDTDISWLSENLRFLNLNQYSRSAAQPGLAVKNINNVLMPVAPYAEQIEMGRLISQMLNVWKQKEIICNKVLNKIDTMKKSILAKAFRGELGTNNPIEDSALNLLKEVLQDKS